MGPTLYRLASERKYDRIPDHVKLYQSDVFWADQHGSTALHLLCQSSHLRRADPPLYMAAVEAVAKEAPSQIACRNTATCTPLHYAAEKRLVWGAEQHHGGTELVLLLLKYCPEAVSVRTRTGIRPGKTPFHIACEANADWCVLKAMLLINPGLATEPYVKKDVYSVAENPLQLLWNNRTPTNIFTPTTTTATATMDNRNISNTMNNATHDKMALLLRAAHYGTVDDSFHQSSPIRLLNAACSVRCPQDYFLQLLEQHTDQVQDLDERNLLPLHYAVEHASVDAQTYTQFVVKSLLEIYPQAASHENAEGRLPLHVALMDSKLTWHKGGIQELVFAYPDALRIRDPLYQLPPVLASAFHAIKSMLHLSTTFELLRTAPDVTEGLLR